MAKVGLLTVHCSTNFGASLQAYALGHYIKNRGNDVKIINYRFENFLDVHDEQYRVGNPLKYMIKKYFLFFFTHGRYVRFHEFEKNCMVEETQRLKDQNSWKELENKYDVYIVGSDQIWNPSHIKYDKAFFFGYIHKGIKASFAASIGKSDLKKEEIVFLKNNANKMAFISVREESARGLLSEICTDKEIEVHADPVFLFHQDCWKKLEKAVRVPNKYALVYVLGRYDAELYREIIKDIKKKGLKVVIIKPRLIGQIGRYNIGPCEFLYLIDQADIVVTNSFHGAAFSILYEKQCIALKSFGKNERLADLFAAIGVSNIQIDSYGDYSNDSWRLDKSDYEKVRMFIEANFEKVNNYFDRIGI